MGKLTKSIEIAASPETVFDFIIDMEKMNKAHEGFTEAQYTSNGPVGVGTTAHFIGTHGGSRTEWNMEITEFEQNKRVSWNSLGPDKLTMIYTVEPTSNGTKLTHFGEYELPYSVLGKLVDKLKVSKDVEKEVTLQLEKAKKALETQAVLTSTH